MQWLKYTTSLQYWSATYEMNRRVCHEYTHTLIVMEKRTRVPSRMTRAFIIKCSIERGCSIKLMCTWHQITIQIRNECARCTRNIQVYMRLTHLVVSSQRLVAVRSRKGYWMKVHCTILTHVHSTIKGDELYTPYLLSEGGNVCIQFVQPMEFQQSHVNHSAQHASAITNMQW